MLQQGLAGKGERSGDRDLRLAQASGKLVLLEDLGPAPAAGTIELHHVAATILVLELINPVFVAVELDEAGVEPQTAEVQRIHDEVGSEIGIVETHVIHHEKGAPLRPILSLLSAVAVHGGVPCRHNRLMNLLGWRRVPLLSSGAAPSRLSTKRMSRVGFFRLKGSTATLTGRV